MNKILVILGPTSSGKSDIAIKLAKKFGGEIISADSRQIFRGMDVGTGKISGKLLGIRPRRFFRGRIPKKIFMSQGVPHYMIDIVSPRTDFNVSKFKKQTERIIEDILRRGKLPVICGGTGFWIKAVVDNVNFPQVKPDWKLRERLEKYSADKLFAMLKKIDPERAKTIDAKNPVRLIRAIEICKAIKHVPKIPDTKYQTQNTRYRFLQIGIKLTKEKLYQNIEKRVLTRFKQGMIKEIENLHAETKLSWKKIQSFGLAYFWIPLYLQNRISEPELFEKVIQAEKNYAKRQITWFKRDKRIRWLENYKEIEKSTRSFLKK
jgi:tRNA dimethylallyltransferase